MKILALDQARLCGYAYGETGKPPTTVLLNLGKTGTPSPEYLWKWGQKVKELIARYDPDILAYEVPFFSAQTATSGSRLIKMEAAIEIIAYGLRIQLDPIHNGTWKKAFCGNAKFNKDSRPYPPILECEQRGIEVDGSTDRADACGIWYCSALKHDPRAMANIDTPLFGRAS